MVYDTTSKKSLDSVPYWIQRASEAEWRTSNGKPLAAVLFGNKTDINNRTSCSLEQAEELSTKHNIKLFMGSAVSNNYLHNQYMIFPSILVV